MAAGREYWKRFAEDRRRVGTAPMVACRRTVLAELGRLDDLPYHLANTVVNVYYRYFCRTQDGDVRRLAWILAARTTVPRMVAVLRCAARELVGARCRNRLVQVMVDIYRYRIPDASQRDEEWRLGARNLRRGAVGEIRGLARTLHLHR